MCAPVSEVTECSGQGADVTLDRTYLFKLLNAAHKDGRSLLSPGAPSTMLIPELTFERF